MSTRTRQRKKARQRRCRIVIEHLTKAINLIAVCLIGWFCYHWKIDPYVGFISITAVWMYLPDIVAYLLETILKCPHNIDTYR